MGRRKGRTKVGRARVKPERVGGRGGEALK